MTEIAYTIETREVRKPINECATNLDGSAFSPEQVEKIEQELRDGNCWAWCHIRVVATCGSIREESYWLPCCSFESEEDFMASSSYERLKEEAHEELRIVLERAHRELPALSAVHDEREKELVVLREASELYKQLTSES